MIEELAEAGREVEKLKRISKNSVALAGEFAVLSQLALRGYDANMTLGHTKDVDILVSDPVTGRLYKLEVKTSYGGKPKRDKLFGHTLSWMMKKKHEEVVDPNLFYCFVNIEPQTNVFRFFLVSSAVVAAYVRAEHELWLNRPYIGERSTTLDSQIRMFRIGLDEGGYAMPTPLARECENKWHLE